MTGNRTSILWILAFRLAVSAPGFAQVAAIPTANAGDAGKSDTATNHESFAFHAQSTLVTQGNLAFPAPYRGPNSLDGGGDLRETFDLTIFAGTRPWKGAEIWINPEIDQGFGLRNTLGAAGFPSAEAYKVGKKAPYLRLQRAFIRQTIDLGGDSERVEALANQLRGSRNADHIVLTMGKFSVVDIFDQNKYAHDPRADFLNWAAVDTGSFDYAADAWGYTYGGAVELYKGQLTFRTGLFNLSKLPNDVNLETNFRQYQIDGEIEERYTIAGRPGAVRLTAFLSHGNFARLDDAVALAKATGNPVDNVPLRAFRNRTGISINGEQEISDTVGIFLRAGLADGNIEAIEFTDIDRTFSGGVSIAGTHWNRDQDRIGIVLVANGISAARKRFLASGGLGILVGDGRLPHPGTEFIAETNYDFAVIGSLHLAADGQLIVNPAYNRDRGPVPVFALRVHAQF